MSEKFLLKDHLFNKTSVIRFADLFYKKDKKFPREEFIKNVLREFPNLELKQRITCMRVELEKILDSDFEKSIIVILNALPEELDLYKTDGDFGDIILAPFSEYIEYNGCSKKYLKKSLYALHEITMRFSVEFTVRNFLNEFPSETFSFLQKCAKAKNYHLRRLASEGLRPSLPWAINININYKKPMVILDLLFLDKTRYVTRSVANHMNDISKIDADLVLNTLKKWELSSKQNKKEMDFIIRHSLRTLIKQGNKSALAMLGYKKPAKVSVDLKKISKIVGIGEKLEFNLKIDSHANQKLMISYYLYFLNKKNDLNPKIFQIKKCELKNGETLELSKKHSLKIMTTKKLYPGKHAVQILVNGLPVTDKKYFNLIKN